ncbi:hypothetical protein BJ508DRAFT_336626 [Ascobolus immersus RN42]|uniref:Uncharacterized protein n=1 Tax=Ascobolus immersus RN42 TaxID=1160509 RepID=A0A3N4HAL9_ASCIM|nr:hypothetical protein BJ508DRAFT_336626 [Ascobolus immersus RN42]
MDRPVREEDPYPRNQIESFFHCQPQFFRHWVLAGSLVIGLSMLAYKDKVPMASSYGGLFAALTVIWIAFLRVITQQTEAYDVYQQNLELRRRLITLEDRLNQVFPRPPNNAQNQPQPAAPMQQLLVAALLPITQQLEVLAGRIENLEGLRHLDTVVPTEAVPAAELSLRNSIQTANASLSEIKTLGQTLLSQTKKDGKASKHHHQEADIMQSRFNAETVRDVAGGFIRFMDRSEEREQNRMQQYNHNREILEKARERLMEVAAELDMEEWMTEQLRDFIWNGASDQA